MIDINKAIESEKYYVYILLDQTTPFYVGKGMKDRIYTHEEYAKGISDLGYGLKKDYNPYKTRKIRKILKEGREITYKIILLTDNEDECFDEEIRLIKLYGRKGIDPEGILTNRTLGGHGGNILGNLSKDDYERAIQNMKGRDISNRTRQLLRESSTGRRHTFDTKKKISKARKGNESGAKEYILRTPQGQIITGTNITKIARKYNLSEDQMRALAYGRIDQYEGWTNPITNPEGKIRPVGVELEYDLISPNGKRIKGKNLTKLVEKYDISTRISYLINGTVDRYKGWIRA